VASPLWQATATAEAEAFVRELGIDALPVCPLAIAKKLEIDVQPLSRSSEPGVSGILLRYDGEFAVLYATYLDNEGFKRFCVGHELGHYRLPGHPESVFLDGVHISQAGFTSKDRFELEADHFAAGLLMPSFLFDAAMDKAGSGLKAIETLAGHCATSLTATAIRYAQRTTEAAAIVVSGARNVDYCFMSDSFREIKGIDWLRKSTVLPRSSVTYRFNSDPANVAHGGREDGESPLQDWFGGDLQVTLYEEVVGLGGYGKTLTILTALDLPDPEEIEEDEDLTDSWTPRFQR
jgi:hypothetical protein